MRSDSADLPGPRKHVRLKGGPHCGHRPASGGRCRIQSLNRCDTVLSEFCLCRPAWAPHACACWVEGPLRPLPSNWKETRYTELPPPLESSSEAASSSTTWRRSNPFAGVAVPAGSSCSSHSMDSTPGNGAMRHACMPKRSLFAHDFDATRPDAALSWIG